jgi:LysR family transcriptional activator of nhaA
VNWLNYHHLYYFWMVATEGGITAASRKLRVAPSTVSAQVQLLEEAIGQPLFHRVGRRLVLTDVGHTTREYSEEIFGLGRELVDVLSGKSEQRFVRRLHVGISNMVPKLVVLRLLQPVFKLDPPQLLVCREDRTDRLLGELATHHIDVMITDAPVPRDPNIRVFNHKLGECGVSLFASPALAESLRENWPLSLRDAPMVLPAQGNTLRGLLDGWFQNQGFRPRIMAEVDDSALLKEIAATGVGAFAAPSVITDDIIRQYRVESLGELPIVEQFYVVSTQRKLRHEGVIALTDQARERIF